MVHFLSWASSEGRMIWDVVENHVWASSQKATRDQNDVWDPCYHLMLWECPWSMSWPKDTLVFMGSAATRTHIDVSGHLKPWKAASESLFWVCSPTVTGGCVCGLCCHQKLCESSLPFISAGNERFYIHSWIRKIRFNWGKPLKKIFKGIYDPDDPTLQSSSAAVSSEFCIQNSFKDADWDDSDSQNSSVRTWL